jgi:hypothetical protein
MFFAAFCFFFSRIVCLLMEKETGGISARRPVT